MPRSPGRPWRATALTSAAPRRVDPGRLDQLVQRRHEVRRVATCGGRRTSRRAGSATTAVPRVTGRSASAAHQRARRGTLCRAIASRTGSRSEPTSREAGAAARPGRRRPSTSRRARRGPRTGAPGAGHRRGGRLLRAASAVNSQPLRASTPRTSRRSSTVSSTGAARVAETARAAATSASRAAVVSGSVRPPPRTAVTGPPTTQVRDVVEGERVRQRHRVLPACIPVTSAL